MADKNTLQTTKSPSRLERYNLGYEYNKTIEQVKREVRLRTFES